MRKTKKTRTKIGISEKQLQQQVEDYLKILQNHWVVGYFITQAENSGIAMQMANKLGDGRLKGAVLNRVSSVVGVFDICCWTRGGRIFFIELKVGKSKLTRRQKLFQDFLNTMEVPNAVCYTFEEARAFIDKMCEK